MRTRRFLQKTGFSLLVIAYVISAMGVPVYLHYCGSEIEDVSYVLAPSGCGEDETDSCCEASADNDEPCCHNEDFLIKYEQAFVLKRFAADLVPLSLQALPPVPYLIDLKTRDSFISVNIDHPPTPWQQALLPDITVLRI